MGSKWQNAAVTLVWALGLILWLRPSTLKSLNINNVMLQAQTGSAVEPVSRHQQQPTACRNGYLTAPRRETFWRYLENGTIPKLADVAVAEGSVFAIFCLKALRGHIPDHGWAAADWWFQFQEAGNESVRASSFGADPSGHTFTAHAPLPSALGAWGASDSLHVTISAPSLGVVYEAVPFCLYPAEMRSYGLVHCTQNLVNANASALFPEWIAYHDAVGFEHAFIYANGPPALLETALAPLAKRGLATVVDWQWPQRYDGRFLFQQAQENSCLVRARGRARWVGLHDLDEFFQPMGGTSVADFVQRLCPVDTNCTAGVLQVQSWFFGAHADAAQQARFTTAAAASRSPTLATWRTRADSAFNGGRQKGLVQPAKLMYWSVHKASKGGPTIAIDPARGLRLAHFRQPWTKSFKAVDNSLHNMSLWVDTMLMGAMAPGWLPQLGPVRPSA